MKGNKLEYDLYNYVTKVFGSHCRQRIYATKSLHTNKLSGIVMKYINYQVIINAFSAPTLHFYLD